MNIFKVETSQSTVNEALVHSQSDFPFSRSKESGNECKDR